jgi:hypothetical protein
MALLLNIIYFGLTYKKKGELVMKKAKKIKEQTQQPIEMPSNIQQRAQESISEYKKQQETSEEILKEIQILKMTFRELMEKDPPTQSKSFFSILDKLIDKCDFDINTLINLGTIFSSLYKNKVETKG